MKPPVKIAILIVFLFVFCLKNNEAPNLSAPDAKNVLYTSYKNTIQQDQIFVFCLPEQYIDTVELELKAISPVGSSPYIFNWYKYDVKNYNYVLKETQTLEKDTSYFLLLAHENYNGLYLIEFVDPINHETKYEKAWVFMNDAIVDIDPIDSSKIEPFNLHGYFNGDADGHSQQKNFSYYEPDTSKFLISESTQIDICFTIDHDTVTQLGFYLETPDSSKIIELLPPTLNWNEVSSANSDTLGCINFDQDCISGADFNDFCFSTNSDVFPCLCEETYPVSGSYTITGKWDSIFGFDPAKNGWQIKLLDCDNNYVGTLKDVILTFKDSVNGEPVTYTHQSNNLNNEIAYSVNCNVNTAYTHTLSSFRGDTITLNNPYEFVWRSSPKVNIPDSSISFNPLVDPYPVLETVFWLFVTDSLGCTFWDSVPFHPTSSKLEMYDAFAPDDPIHPSEFKLKEAELIRQFNIMIYNRYGQMVFESDDPYFSWNGKKFNNGPKLPSGTYFYIVQAVGWDNKDDYFLETSEPNTTNTGKSTKKQSHIYKKGTVYLYRGK